MQNAIAIATSYVYQENFMTVIRSFLDIGSLLRFICYVSGH